MTEFLALATTFILVIGAGCYTFIHHVRSIHAGYYRVNEAHSRREQAYLKMIKDLQNRLSAKDLTGYLTLQNNAEVPSRPQAISRSDEDEAKIEELRLGIAQSLGSGLG